MVEGSVLITGVILTATNGQALEQFYGLVGPVDSATVHLFAASGAITYSASPYVVVPGGTPLISIGVKVTNLPAGAYWWTGLVLVGGPYGEPKRPTEGYQTPTGSVHFPNIPSMTSYLEIDLLNSTKT